MRAAIIVFPGSNCDRDMQVAIASAFEQPPVMVWHQETTLPEGVDLVAAPGGFSYGDYLRAGAIAAHSPIMPALARHVARGGYALGVCNGWQILIEAGLLPGALLRNRDTRFIARDVHLLVEADSAFTSGYAIGQVLKTPVAHHDGNFKADAETLAALEGEGRVAFRYCEPDGAVTEAANVNGSDHAIAGVLSENRRVLGLMPHPERAIAPALGSVDGRALFAALAAA